MHRSVLMIALFFIALSMTTTAFGSIRFGGVGIDGVPRQNGEILVRQLVAGGPAQQAGLRIGDIITHIDGRPTRGCNFREIVEKRLRGREGSKLRLTVHRSSRSAPRNFILTRRQLIYPGT